MIKRYQLDDPFRKDDEREELFKEFIARSQANRRDGYKGGRPKKVKANEVKNADQ
jgi:hypothetical protein